MDVLSREDIIKLIISAREAKEKSHSPFSKFSVGAAILTTDNQVIKGCNIENVSYTLGICAERCAVFKAISDGHTKFKALAIISDSGKFITPCGACRQIMHEFGGDYQVFLSKSNLEYKEIMMKDLLPMAFDSAYTVCD